MDKYESPGLQQERKERFQMKSRLLKDSLGQDVAEKAATPGIEKTESITRASLEEEARRSTVSGHGSPTETYVHIRNLYCAILIWL